MYERRFGRGLLLDSPPGGESNGAMRTNASLTVSFLAWVAVGFALLATAGWIAVVADGNNVWAAFAFALSMSVVDVGILALAVVPSGFLYARGRERHDLLSLLLAVGAFGVIVLEIALLYVLPMRGE